MNYLPIPRSFLSRPRGRLTSYFTRRWTRINIGKFLDSKSSSNKGKAHGVNVMTLCRNCDKMLGFNRGGYCNVCRKLAYAQSLPMYHHTHRKPIIETDPLFENIVREYEDTIL